MINLWSWRQPTDSWSFTKLQQQWVTARWSPWTWVVGCSQPLAQRSHRSRTRFLAECSTPPPLYHLHGWSMAPSSSMPIPTSLRFGRSLSAPPLFGYIDSTQLQNSSHPENAISWIYKKVKRWFWISSVTDAFCSHQVCHWRLFWPKPGIKDSFFFRIFFVPDNTPESWHWCIQVFWIGESAGWRRRTWRGGESPNQRRWNDLWDNKSHPHWFLKSILRTLLEVAAATFHFQPSLTLILQNCCQKEIRSFSWTFVQRSNSLSFILRLISISQSGFWSAFMFLALWCP